MNKFLLILLISVSLTGNIHAQQIGIKGGLNFINVSSAKDLDLSSSNAFHLGVAFEMPILGLTNVSTGLFYTRRGYESMIPGKEGKAHIDYLDIPVDFLLKFKLANLVGGYLSAGPYFSYGMSSKVFGEDGILKNGYNEDNIDLKRIDTGFNIGTGVDFSSFKVGAAYGFSLTNNGSIKDNVTKNRVLKISVGYFFN